MTRFVRSLDSHEYFTYCDSAGVACEKKEKNPFQKISQFGKNQGDRAAQKSIRGLNSWHPFTSLMEHLSGASNNFCSLGGERDPGCHKTEMNFKLLRQ